MTKKQIALLIVQIICAFILAVLPFVDQARIDSYTEDDIRKHLYHLFYDYRGWWAVVSALVVSTIPTVEALFNPRKKNKEVRANIMDTMMEDLFPGDRQNVRITVFRDAGINTHIWIYVKLYLLNARRQKYRLPPKGKYICVKERQGTEFKGSKTCLYYSPETRKKCHGVAGVVRQSLEEIVVKDLPDVDQIDLSRYSQTDIATKRTAEVKKIRKYMENGHLRDIEALKRINKLARHFYGNILQNSQGTPKGVLVIDSWQQKCPFDDPAVMKKLSFYLALFTPTM